MKRVFTVDSQTVCPSVLRTGAVDGVGRLVRFAAEVRQLDGDLRFLSGPKAEVPTPFAVATVAGRRAAAGGVVARGAA
jgi:hypothetical protein